MRKLTFQKLGQKHRDYLEKFLKANKQQVRHQLHVASAQQLTLLLQLVHFIANGDIPLRKDLFPGIVKSKKLPFIRSKFENVKEFVKVKRAPREEKLSLLYKLQGQLPMFVAVLF
jgi:hypothetical protein